MRLLKTLLITVGVVMLLWLCTPLLIGTMYWFTARSQYNSTPPSKVSSLRIPDSDVTISLFRKAQPRAVSYEGEYRILEVSRPAQSNLYFELFPSAAGDNPNLKAYWFPANRCLKIVDSGRRDGPQTSAVFLDAATIVHLHNHGMATEPKGAMSQLQFPSASSQWSMEFTESEVSIPDGDGILVGTLERPRSEDGQPGATLPPAPQTGPPEDAR